MKPKLVNEEYKNVLNDAVLIALETHAWGNTKKIPIEKLRKITGKKLSKWVRSNKGLIDTEALADINSEIGGLRQIFKTHALPFPIISVYMVPINDLDKVCDLADASIERIQEKVEEFEPKYKDYIELAKEELGEDLFDPNDYPTDIKKKFSATYRIVKIDVPGELEKINPALYKAEMQKFKQTMVDAKNDCILYLRESFIKELKGVINSLTEKDKEGKSKKIRSETVEKMDKFFEYFNTKNIFQDTEFYKLVKDTRAIMAGITSKDLRESDGLKKVISEEMKKVAEIAEKGIVKFKRSIKF
jgi:hypothetical protein